MAIKMAWQRKAAERYRALMCSLRKGKEKTMHVSDSAWKLWTEAWNSPDFKARVKNLLQIGSVRLEDMDVRLKLGREPLPYELFKVTHTKKGASELIDARSQSIQDRYLELMEQASQTQEGHGEPPIVDEAAVYYEAVGGEKKRRVYGVGSQGSVFYPQISQSLSTGTSSKAVNNEIRELQQTVV
ncbi:uncharacterized protein LOC120258302 [Dioscorea cayenensis subsp. rotundata]|uniref:Uncharacterized protein LOC120258302 n=1 Tax=Dioscorea cayennensis subsp. rotundata TaxID=55577 RepID=A0AB40B2X9_DIOCR|nr:uncharacterized protein LOC120258302 [Dioscorea cayenensis subsp. rotundata]